MMIFNSYEAMGYASRFEDNFPILAFIGLCVMGLPNLGMAFDSMAESYKVFPQFKLSKDGSIRRSFSGGCAAFILCLLLGIFITPLFVLLTLIGLSKDLKGIKEYRQYEKNINNILRERGI